MIQQEALQKTNVADKSFFKRISPQRESRKNPQSQRLCGFMVAGARFELTTFGL